MADIISKKYEFISKNTNLYFFFLLLILEIYIFYSFKPDLGGDTEQYLFLSENFTNYLHELFKGNIDLKRFPGYILFIKSINYFNKNLNLVFFIQLLIFNFSVYFLITSIDIKKHLFLYVILLSPITIYSQKLIYPDGLIFSLLIIIYVNFLKNNKKLYILFSLILFLIKSIFWFLIPLILFKFKKKIYKFFFTLALCVTSFLLIYFLSPGKLVDIAVERPGYIKEIYNNEFNRELYLDIKVDIENFCNLKNNYNFIDKKNKRLTFFKSDYKNKNGYSLSSEEIDFIDPMIKQCLNSNKKKFQRKIFIFVIKENLYFHSKILIKTFIHTFSGWNLNDHLSYQMQNNINDFKKFNEFFSKEITNKYSKILSLLMIINLIYLIIQKKINYKNLFSYEFLFLFNYSVIIMLSAQHPQDRYMLFNIIMFYFFIKKIKINTN